MFLVKKNVVITTLFTVVIGFASNAIAFGLGSIPGLGGGGSSGGANVDSAALVKRAESIIYNFTVAGDRFDAAINTDKAGAMEKAKASQCSSGKGCSSEEAVEAMKAQSEKRREQIQRMMDNGEKLSEAAKAKFATGLAPFGFGTLKGVAFLKDLKDAIPALKNKLSSNPFGALGEINSLISLASTLPPAFEEFSSSAGLIYDFATYNGIEKPPAQEEELPE